MPGGTLIMHERMIKALPLLALPLQSESASGQLSEQHPKMIHVITQGKSASAMPSSIAG